MIVLKKNTYKLLVDCNNKELLHEESYRNELLRKERSRKNRITCKSLVFSVLLLLVAAGWFYIKREMDTVNFIIGTTSVINIIATLERAEKQTEFEQRQIAVLNKIHTLLRERGVR